MKLNGTSEHLGPAVDDANDDDDDDEDDDLLSDGQHS